MHTVVTIVKVNNFLPSVMAYGINNCFVVVGSHAYGEIQETRRWRQHLKSKKKKKQIKKNVVNSVKFAENFGFIFNLFLSLLLNYKLVQLNQLNNLV